MQWECRKVSGERGQKMEWFESGYERGEHLAWEIRKLWSCSVCGHKVHSLNKPSYDCPMCKDRNRYVYEYAPALRRFVRIKKGNEKGGDDE